jgi:hypothetical protein
MYTVHSTIEPSVLSKIVSVILITHNAMPLRTMYCVPWSIHREFVCKVRDFSSVNVLAGVQVIGLVDFYILPPLDLGLGPPFTHQFAEPRPRSSL